jgi:hypothetical protein
MKQQLLSGLPHVHTERFILGIYEQWSWNLVENYCTISVPTNGTSLLANDLQDRVLYRRGSSDNESNSICWGAPDHPCHTLDHEACLYRLH